MTDETPTVDSLDSSILDDTKKLLGLDSEYDAFDKDVTININSAFAKLNQLGVGPSNVFSISGKKEVWRDFTSDSVDYGMIKMYIYLNTRLSFDLPQNSFLVSAIKEQVTELEWRLNMESEFNKSDV